MEVSNVRDHVTHAVISGGKTIDFGISDSPEFFHILSSTLYSDQPLAVVREVLCNAWDAHIEAGCANKPVEVTLSDQELVIRDFGAGISDDNIGPIYGVYGGSTKKKNKLVTGGFGLGCKAPFAYTDHFEVTSWHAGRKTIYNMSKSSAEVNGRPGIVPIASFPTDETGLQVRIQLKDRHDRYRFEQLIERIAANGEMSVVLNGEPIDVLPFSTMKHGFMLTRLPVVQTTHRVLIRYGHVIYPVDSHESYSLEYDTILKFLASLPDGYKIIFQAKPDSISVTPSRESLSMQEHTIKTLTQIFGDFWTFLNTNLETESFHVLQSAIVEAWVGMKPHKLFITEEIIPGLSRRYYNDRPDTHEVMVDMRDIAKVRSCWNYPEYKNFRFTDLLTRLDTLIQASFGDTGLINSYRSELIRLNRRKRLEKGHSSWFHRKVIGPLVRDLKAAGMNISRLSVYGKHPDYGRFRWEEQCFTEATAYPPRPLEHFLPFLRNVVVLTHNRLDVENRVNRFPIMKNWLGWGTNVLVYAVPRSSKPKTDQAREFFKARGVQLIDLTIYHPWETTPTPVVKEKVEKAKPKPKGLPVLGSLLNGGIRMDFFDFEDEERDIKRTDKPKVAAKLPRSERAHCFEYFDRAATDAICQLWPNDIAVATNTPQLQKYIDAGAVPLNKWVVEHVCAEVQKNKRIHREIALDYDRIKGFYYHDPAYDMFQLIYRVDALRKKFKVGSQMTELDQHYFAIWNCISNWSRYDREKYPEIGKTKEIVDAIELSPAVSNLHELLERRRPVLKIFDTDEIRPILLSEDSTRLKPFEETTMKIVLLALKG